MKREPVKLVMALSSAMVLTLAGCGGGGGDAPAAAATVDVLAVPTTLTGTAAIGAPISGSVFAIDINGKVSPVAPTTGLGAFVVDVGGMTAPFILSITGTAGGKPVTLNSIATAAGQTVNITPLTDLIVSSASGRPGGSSLVALCAPNTSVTPAVVPAACLAALGAASAPAKLNAAIAAVVAMIGPLNGAGTNPLTGAFRADGTGMDGVLDQILVSPADAQSAMATVTLIATNKPLGTVVLPANPGDASTLPAPTPPSTTELAQATAAATVLPEIRACLASFSALYPKTGFVAPTTQRVTEFLDPSFRLGRLGNQATFALAFSGTSAEAVPGFTLEATGFSPYDMSPLNAAEISALQVSTSSSALNSAVDFVKARSTTAVGFSNGAATSAWIKLHVVGDAGGNNWKMVKGAAYTGCAGGWKLAGGQHVEMHQNARIQRSMSPSAATTFTRQWAFHIDKENLADEVAAGSPAIDSVVVRGPGLSIYSGTPSAPVGVSQRLVLALPPAGSLDSNLRVGGSTFYGNADALQSCQDLAGTAAPAGTPCIDETQVGPGKQLYSWVLKTGGASGTIVAAFAFQINAVPLSKAFAQANQANLFATITSVTPSSIAAVNTSLATFATGAALDNVFTFNYTQSATYGSRMDNCGLGLTAGSVVVLRAEQNAVGSETSCTFRTSGLNAGTLTKPVGAVDGGFIGITTTVLGNQASSSQPY